MDVEFDFGFSGTAAAAGADEIWCVVDGFESFLDDIATDGVLLVLATAGMGLAATAFVDFD